MLPYAIPHVTVNYYSLTTYIVRLKVQYSTQIVYARDRE